MHVVACDAPIGSLEPAPLTSLPLDSALGNTELRAFWSDNDEYFIQAMSSADTLVDEARWFRIQADDVVAESSLAERTEIGRLLSDITPIGGGRVAFPVGSSGRRFYRVWRTGAAGKAGRTKILEVRAARSRRLPA